jgi:hypothetical protein
MSRNLTIFLKSVRIMAIENLIAFLFFNTDFGYIYRERERARKKNEEEVGTTNSFSSSSSSSSSSEQEPQEPGQPVATVAAPCLPWIHILRHHALPHHTPL